MSECESVFVVYLEPAGKLVGVENVGELGKSIGTCGVVMAAAGGGGQDTGGTNFSPKKCVVFGKHITSFIILFI